MRAQPDSLGLDLESIARDSEGEYWMGDEYRPSICRFSRDGVLLDRFVPKGLGDFGEEAFPAVYAYRGQNRGFEGIAFRGGKIYAFLQSPLAIVQFSRAMRVLEFDPKTRSVSAEYFFMLDDAFNDRKLGDVTVLPGGDFLMIEQTSEIGIGADKKVYRLSLDGATNLSDNDFAVNRPQRTQLVLVTLDSL